VVDSYFHGTEYHELVPFHHLAAFCRQFPNLEEVQGGAIDGLAFEENPNVDWQCLTVKRLSVLNWGVSDRGKLSREKMLPCIRTYFPASDLAVQEFSPDDWLFA
jgi:hypothetical protein